MKIFIDESGDFSLPSNPEDHAVGIVVGIVIPDENETEILDRFKCFLAQLSRSEFKNGEPKGYLLSDESRKSLADLFFDFDHILVCPIMLDITSLACCGAVQIKESLVKKLREWASLCKHETLRSEVKLLERQVSNRKMSLPVVLRLVTWARCIMRCLQDSVIFHSRPEYHSSWEKLRFEIDPVRPGTSSRETQVFEKLLPAWITGWSLNTPLTMIEEIHSKNHPFVQNWVIDEGIDVGKMLRDNVHYPESQSSLGLQMADMSATLVRKAVIGLVNSVDLENYGFMMTNSIRSAPHALGIFTIVEPSEADIGRRYAGLTDAISGAKQSKRRSHSLP